jgi:hypothetical protein
MAMSKKDFIALADTVKTHNKYKVHDRPDLEFQETHLETLADFCQSQNPNFNRGRWLGYIEGTNGPSGGRR